MPYSDYEKLIKILAILGGIIAIIEGVLGVAGTNFGNPSDNFRLVSGIAAIGLGIIVLYASFRPDDPIPFDWIVLLILGILLVIFTAIIGGILVIVSAIIAILEENL
jgi:peptidoglycan/LPS O-acetylase OafA/YrhL